MDVDLTRIFALQYRAYQIEDRLLDNFSIPPLRKSVEDLLRQFEECVVFLNVGTTSAPDCIKIPCMSAS